MPNYHSNYHRIKFIYSHHLGFDPRLGKFLVEGEEYELKYEETPALTMSVPTGAYKIDADGNLVKSTKIEITGNSYINANDNRIDVRYGTSLDRHDKEGRDLVEIIKNSIVAWMKIS